MNISYLAENFFVVQKWLLPKRRRQSAEDKLMRVKINEYVNDRAAKNIDFFLNQDRPRSIEDWDKISLIKDTHIFRKGDIPILSPLDRFQQENKGMEKLTLCADLP